MRSRNEIEAEQLEHAWSADLKEDTKLILEVLLDIRDILNNPLIEITEEKAKVTPMWTGGGAGGNAPTGDEGGGGGGETTINFMELVAICDECLSPSIGVVYALCAFLHKDGTYYTSLEKMTREQLDNLLKKGVLLVKTEAEFNKKYANKQNNREV